MAKKLAAKSKRSSDSPSKFSLTKEDFKEFFDILSRPPAPNTKLKDAFLKYKEGRLGNTISPFTYEFPVLGKNFLYHTGEVKAVAQRLLDPALIFISAYSGFGKTSFALDLQQELKVESNVTVVYSNLKNCRNEFQLISTYVRDVAKALEVSIDWTNVNEEHFDRLFFAQLPETLASSLKKKVIIILDDFDSISGMKDQIQIEGLLRSLWQNLKSVSMCVVMKITRDTMFMIGRYNRPFYGTGMHISLKEIPEQIWHEYLSRKFADANRIISTEAITYILSKMNNTPRSIQNLAHEIFISNASKITIKVVDTAINKIVSDHCFGYDILFKIITKHQLRVLLGYILRKPIDIPPQWRKKTLAAIDDIVRQSRKPIPVFIDPFFQIYLERRFSKSGELKVGPKRK